MQQHKFIRLPEVIKLTGLPKSTIYRRIAENSFPKQIQIGGKTVIWTEESIRKWQSKYLSANDNS
jgi:prophage regulatory protein